MSTSIRALNAYRAALRSTKTAFTKDVATLNAARSKIKEEMKLEISTTHPKLDLAGRVELLEQVNIFLRQNIVQGVKKENDESRYVLNIHKETELGDNDDIKKTSSTLKTGQTTGGCCGGGKVELEQKN